MQSGTSLNIWALRRGARADAFDVGSKLAIITENSTELVNKLMELPFQQVQQASVDVAQEVRIFVLKIRNIFSRISYVVAVFKFRRRVVYKFLFKFKI